MLPCCCALVTGLQACGAEVVLATYGAYGGAGLQNSASRRGLPPPRAPLPTEEGARGNVSSPFSVLATRAAKRFDGPKAHQRAALPLVTLREFAHECSVPFGYKKTFGASCATIN